MFLKDLNKKLTYDIEIPIKFNELVDKYDLDPDTGMMGDLIACDVIDTFIQKENGEIINFYDVKIDLSNYISKNIKADKLRWFDKNGKPSLPWTKTIYYPKNNIYSFILQENMTVPFNLI